MDSRNLSKLPEELKLHIAKKLEANNFFNTSIHLVDKSFHKLSNHLLKKEFSFFVPINNPPVPNAKKYLHQAAYLYQRILTCTRPDQTNRFYAKLYDVISCHPNEPEFQFYLGLILLNGKGVKRKLREGFDILVNCVEKGDPRAAEALLLFDNLYGCPSHTLSEILRVYIIKNKENLISILKDAYKQNKQTAKSLAYLFQTSRNFALEQYWLEQAPLSRETIARIALLQSFVNSKNNIESKEYLQNQLAKDKPSVFIAEMYYELAKICDDDNEKLDYFTSAHKLGHIDATTELLNYISDEAEKNRLLMFLFNANDIQATQDYYHANKSNFTVEKQTEFQNAFLQGNFEAIKLLSLYARSVTNNTILTIQQSWWIQLAADMGDEKSFLFLIKRSELCALTMLYLYGQARNGNERQDLLVKTAYEFDADKALAYFNQIPPEHWSAYLNNGIEHGFITEEDKDDINNRIQRLALNAKKSQLANRFI